jgi:uncharacterized protein YfkK (UPF0435 family)
MFSSLFDSNNTFLGIIFVNVGLWFLFGKLDTISHNLGSLDETNKAMLVELSLIRKEQYSSSMNDKLTDIYRLLQDIDFKVNNSLTELKVTDIPEVHKLLKNILDENSSMDCKLQTLDDIKHTLDSIEHNLP